MADRQADFGDVLRPEIAEGDFWVHDDGQVVRVLRVAAYNIRVEFYVAAQLRCLWGEPTRTDFRAQYRPAVVAGGCHVCRPGTGWW